MGARRPSGKVSRLAKASLALDLLNNVSIRLVRRGLNRGELAGLRAASDLDRRHFHHLLSRQLPTQRFRREDGGNHHNRQDYLYSPTPCLVCDALYYAPIKEIEPTASGFTAASSKIL